MYPTTVWDGDSKSRDSDKAPFRGPDANDWDRMIKEVAATQKQLGLGAFEGAAGTSVVKTSQDYSAVQKIVLTVDELSIAIVDGTTKEYGSYLIFVPPAGEIKMIASIVDLACARVGTSLSATADGDYALGTTVATDADLATTQVDLHQKTTIAALVAGAGPIVGLDDEKALIDPTDTIYLNVIFDAGTLSSGDDAILVTGTVTLYYMALGEQVN